MDIAKKLAEFVYDLDIDKVPEDVKLKAKICLLNSLGVGVSGWQLGPATHARRIARQLYGKETGKRATLAMDGSSLTMDGAVFANTVLFHSRAQEDTLGGCHCGTMIVPVALAVAQNYDCSGKELEEAVLAGYEVTGVIEKNMCKYTDPRGFRPSAIYVIFGVAAAAAKLMKLDVDGIADSIRICASLLGGIQQSFAAGTTEWFYQNACAAQKGLLAAQLAEDGVEGALSAFDGVKGFVKVMAGIDSTEEIESELPKLGKEWKILNVMFKLNPCCMIAQTPFIASCDLANEKNIQAEDIKHIDYHMNPLEGNYAGTKGKGPFKTDTQTTMSCAFNIANAIVHRACTKKGMQVFDDARILDLVEKIDVVDDESYELKSGKVVITMNDGTVHQKEMVITPQFYNLTWEENEKLMYKIHKEVGLPSRKTKALIDSIKNLDDAKNICSIMEVISEV